MKHVLSLLVLMALVLSACGTQQNLPAPISFDEPEISGTQNEKDPQPNRLFPYNGEQLCAFERKTESEETLNSKKNHSSVLLFDYETESYVSLDLPDFRTYSGVTASAPVLWNGKVLTVECRALRCPAYDLFMDAAPSRLFLSDPESKDTSVIETDEQYYLFGSPVWGIPDDESHILITGSRGEGEETLLLKVDLTDGSVEDLGGYSETDRDRPVNGMPFDLRWEDADGYTYGYRGSGGIDAQALYRKRTGVPGDYECIVEDCYPEDYYNPYTGSFRVLGNTVYYYGVCQGESKIPTVFCFDLDSGSIIRRERESGESLMPVDQYGEYLVLAGPEQVRNGVPLPADGVRIIGKEQYMENDSSGIPFAEESDIVRIDGQSPQMSSSMTDLSWITENGAVGFFNSLYTPEKQTTDILAYYDFESLTFKLFELPEMIRGRTNLHKLYLLDNLVIGFSARVEEQGGNNHIIDDSIDSHLVIWDTTNNNLKDVRLDPDYYLYAHKLMISANVDNAFYVLGCYKQNKDVLLLKINTDDGSIENLGVYEEKKNSFNTGKQGTLIAYDDSYTYYKFVEQTGDDIKQSLIRVDGTNEERIIEDMFPGNISSPAENMYFLSDGILYYYGIDRDKIEGYVFEANLHTGELQYRIATEEEGGRKGVSRHGEYLIFGPPINPSGVLHKDALLAIKAEDFINDPVFVRFVPIS